MIKNFFWDFLGRLGSQAIGILFSVILTRIISPAEFGLMGMALVLISIAGVFLDMGFRLALVQKVEVSKEEYSGVFFVSIAMSIFLTTICYFMAKPLSIFYGQPPVEAIIKTLSIVFILNALLLIPNTIVYKRMNFKIISLFNIIAATISGALGIYLAYTGHGVWSLVVQTLTSSIILVFLYQFHVRWIPLLNIRLTSVKELWSYGSRMFLANLSDGIFSRLDVFIIGRLFPVDTLGFYTRAQTFDQLIKQFSANNIIAVLFPHIAALQNDRERLQVLYIKYLHLIAFVALGMSGILYVIALPLFIILFTAKWLFAAELFKIMALMAFGWPVSALMCNIIAGVGNSKALLRLEIPKRSIMLLAFVFGFFWGIKGFLYTMVGISIITISLNAFVCGRQIQFSLSAQWKIMTHYILAAGISVLVSEAALANLHLVSPYLNIGVGATVFCVFYLLINYFTKAKGFTDLLHKLFFTKIFKTSIV